MQMKKPAFRASLNSKSPSSRILLSSAELINLLKTTKEKEKKETKTFPYNNDDNNPSPKYLNDNRLTLPNSRSAIPYRPTLNPALSLSLSISRHLPHTPISQLNPTNTTKRPNKPEPTNKPTRRSLPSPQAPRGRPPLANRPLPRATLSPFGIQVAHRKKKGRAMLIATITAGRSAVFCSSLTRSWAVLW